MRFFQGLERAGREAASVALGRLLNVQKISLPDLRQELAQGPVRKILARAKLSGHGRSCYARRRLFPL